MHPRLDESNTFEDLLTEEEEGVCRRTFFDILPNSDTSSATGSSTHKRTTVSYREYYVYKLQIRPNDQSYLLRFGRLLQQYVIDNYTPSSDVDEIANFQNARWVSLVEVTWRIFGFPLHGMYPAVLQLQVHMPNFQTIHFEDDADLEELLRDERQKRSMLTEFFRTNGIDPVAKQLNLLYKKILKHFVWDNQMRYWTHRKKGTVVGRLA